MNIRDKKFTRFQLRFYLKVMQILGLAGLLTSCVRNDNDPAPMYGIIPVEGEIMFHGTVRSEDSLINISGLSVHLVDELVPDSGTTISTANGEYFIFAICSETDLFKLKIYDTDGAANVGDFENKVLDVQVSSMDVINGDRQVDVLLKKK